MKRNRHNQWNQWNLWLKPAESSVRLSRQPGSDPRERGHLVAFTYWQSRPLCLANHAGDNGADLLTQPSRRYCRNASCQANACAFTLTEMLVVIAIVVLLATLVMPAFTKMMQSNRTSTAKSLARAMLARAQAHAVANQKYAGVRFQFDRDGWQTGKQYMVLIEKASSGNDYIAVANVKTVTLPEGVGVLSADVIDDTNFSLSDFNLDDSDLGLSDNSMDVFSLNGAVTLSVVFSPTGQLVVKSVDVWPRRSFDDGSEVYFDTTFSHFDRVNLDSTDPDKALLYCDAVIWQNDYDIPPFNTPDDPVPWLGAKESATGFYIFETGEMADTNAATRFSDYVSTLEPLLVNRYTAGLIEEE